MTVFDTDPLQCVFWRISQRNSVVIDLNLRLRPKAGRKTSLATNIEYSFAPQGHSFGLETGTYGYHSVRAGALDAQIGAQNPQRVGSQATRAALGPGLVRLGRLGAVMATRVKNV